MGQHKNKPNNSKKKSNGLRKRLNSASNMTVMLIAGVISIELMYFLIQYFPKWISLTDKVQESAGYWNFLIVLISVPVALVVWHFRDENNRQQIENQRKDINLKEFQKLSEWVSGAHLPEIKTVSKTTNKRNLKSDDEIARQLTLPIEYTTEEIEEYSKQPNTTDFDTFSKRDGAIALQISAIYNLLPFFRGDYGESFRLPAFDLLKSTWQIMQQDSLKMFKKTGSVSELERRAKSPLGIALTHVLLSYHKDNNQIILRDFCKILPSMCLAGINFNLGADEDVVINLSGLRLNEVDFRGATLRRVGFQKSELSRAKLQNANLWMANLQSANLQLADFQSANLQLADLQMAILWLANFRNANLESANLESARLWLSNLQLANLQYAKLRSVSLESANLESANLESANLQYANLKYANLQCANLKNTDLQFVNLIGCQFEWKQLKDNRALGGAQITEKDFSEKIYPDWKEENDSEWETLTGYEQTEVMQKFCAGTGMLIVDEDGVKIEHLILEDGTCL